MEKNKKQFEVRRYFDTYLEKEWVFNTKDEAQEFYNMMNRKRISNLVTYEIRKVRNGDIRNE